MKKFVLAFLFLVATLPALAQQDPLYSQYFNNPMLINPAFAGSNERLYAGVAYRSQWSGIDGTPTTFNVNSHIALRDNKVGVGFLAVQDKIGDIKNTQFGGVASYRIKLSTVTTFSFGMQAGFTRYATDPNAVNLVNTSDPLFNQLSETKFNIGAGALLQSERYTFGLSMPRMLPSTISQIGGQSVQIYSQNFYVFGAYVFYVSEKIQFKPSTLLRATAGTPLSVDVNCNFVFNRLYTAGLFTRKLNSYGILVQMVMNNYRLGYVFEVPGKGSALNYNTHEVSLSLSLAVLQSHNRVLTGF
jgi:type IX secretion system PorP/SprF family membrane protein